MDWSQGGYGFYVWGSYLFALLALGAEVLGLRRRKKSIEHTNSASAVKGNNFNETTS